MKIFSIAKYDLIKMLRDKSSFIVMLILPIAFTLIFGSMSFSSENDPRIEVGISNLDNSQMSKALIEGVSKDKTIKLVEMDEDKLYDKVKKSEIEMGFIIPNGFEQNAKSGKAPEIKTLKLSSSQDYAVIQSIISNTFTSMQVKEGTASYLKDKFGGIPDSGLNELSANLDSRLKSPAITVKETVVSGTGEKVKYNGSASMSITAILMFVMFTVILGAGDILEERKNNTWGRLSITSTGRSTIILGKVLGNFLKGWIQVAILILFSKFVMGVDWGNALIPTLILISVYLLAVLGLGMFLSSLVKTHSQLGAVSAIVITATTMLSGCYWPLEIEPEFMQKLAYLFPQYWANTGLTKTVVGNEGIGSIALPVLILLGMGVVYFVLSIMTGGFKLDTKKSPRISKVNKTAAQQA